MFVSTPLSHMHLRCFSTAKQHASMPSQPKQYPACLPLPSPASCLTLPPAEPLHPTPQAGCREQVDIIRPYSCLPYAWEEPALKQRLIVSLPGERRLGEFALEVVGQRSVVILPASARRGGDGNVNGRGAFNGQPRSLVFCVVADGPARVLRVIDPLVHPTIIKSLGEPFVGTGGATTSLWPLGFQAARAAATTAAAAAMGQEGIAGQRLAQRRRSSLLPRIGQLNGAAAATAAEEEALASGEDGDVVDFTICLEGGHIRMFAGRHSALLSVCV